MSFFDALWSNYPDEDPCDARDDSGGPLFRNQCAIRLSQALNKSGVSLAAFPSRRKCWVHRQRHEVRAAAELANWLETHPDPRLKRSIDITGSEWRSKITDRKGIVCFEDYYPATHGSGGDHIDLWNGGAMTGTGSWLRTRLNIVIPGLWSDLRDARRIRFLEVAS